MDKIGIFDFGGQYCHLIARRIRELGVYSEIIHEPKKEFNGFILSGGPRDIYEKESPKLAKEFFDKVEVPVLGICYGHQMIAQAFGGAVKRGKEREYGKKIARVNTNVELFQGLNDEEIVWMSHFDQVIELPEGFEKIAETDICPIAAYQNKKKNLFGVQFHPEVIHTPKGNIVLDNFLKITDAKKEWKLKGWVEEKLTELKSQIGLGNVIMAVSGGVDSTVAAVLLARAGIETHFVYVDTGLMRLHETQEVETIFQNLGIENFHILLEEEKYLKALKGITDPEKKRVVIGNLFVEIFEKKAKELGDFQFLGQGTIYPDRIESAQPSTHANLIKTHHNVGGLPEKMALDLVEPLNELYKDEVRKIARALGLPEKFINRHPFPGPALAIRILGEVTKERLEILRKADAIVTEVIQKNGLYDKLWQVFPALIPVKSVGVMGDKRTYENMIAIRAVESKDAMTADWSKLPYNVLEEMANQIVNRVQGINRILYDITSKPPGTIEYE